jgi:AcrR family transcriptional regulator
MTPRSAKPRPAKKEGYHHGDLRRALLDGALRLISSGKTQELSLREVARIAGVTHAAPYRHFVDKEALLAAVAEEGFRNLRGHIERRMAKAKDAAEAFKQSGVGYVAFALESPAHFRVMFGGHLGDFEKHPALASESQKTFEVLVSAIVAAQNAGRVKKGNPLPMAIFAWSGVHGLSSLLIDNQLHFAGFLPADFERIARDHVERTLDGLSLR